MPGVAAAGSVSIDSPVGGEAGQTPILLAPSPGAGDAAYDIRLLRRNARATTEPPCRRPVPSEKVRLWLAAPHTGEIRCQCGPPTSAFWRKHPSQLICELTR